MAMLTQILVILTLVTATTSVVLYLRAQSLRQFERACQARMDALRSAAELREIGARTSRQLRDAALDEAGRMKGHRP